MFLWKHFYNSVNEFDMEIENVDQKVHGQINLRLWVDRLLYKRTNNQKNFNLYCF